MTGQHYKNHRRFVPLYHFVTFTLLLAVLIGAIVNVANSAHQNMYSASLLVVLTVAVILSTFYARAFALKAQDRAIRAEENLRHYLLTGQLFDSRLHTQQIVALRFAGDTELGALAKRAADESMKPEDIKKAIQHWRGDYYRV
jgi:hypothetical protein